MQSWKNSYEKFSFVNFKVNLLLLPNITSTERLPRDDDIKISRCVHLGDFFDSLSSCHPTQPPASSYRTSPLWVCCSNYHFSLSDSHQHSSIIIVSILSLVTPPPCSLIPWTIVNIVCHRFRCLWAHFFGFVRWRVDKKHGEL